MSAPLGPEPVVASASSCMDCGAPIAGRYCSNCGQETEIRTPTVRQFAHEMMDQYVAVEGKLGRTLRVLITRPGQLTLDYVEGRRQRYVRPLKLYVSISVVFFGALGLLPDSLSNPFIQVDPAAMKQGLQELKQEQDAKAVEPAAPDAPAAPGTPAPPPAAAASGDNDLKAQIERDLAEGLKSGQRARLGDSIKRDVETEVRKQQGERAQKVKPGFLAEKLADPKDRERLRAKLLDEAPYAMFFLMPYFALLLRWLYRKNKQLYGVHLLFAVHLHCFAFLLLLVMLVPWQPWRQLMELVGAVYVFYALRRVYGGTWKRTLWRMSLLYVLYIAAVGATALSGALTAAFGSSL